MQNKGFVKVFAVLLTLVCLFYLSFSFVTNRYNKKAAEYAGGDPVKESLYLDSLSTEKVWLGYTLKECREMEISLGLDLKGGMNVILELSVPDVIRSLSNNNPDENFNKALDLAYAKQASSQKDFISLFADEYKALDSNARLATIFSTFELKEKITPQSSDDQVIAVIIIGQFFIYEAFDAANRHIVHELQAGRCNAGLSDDVHKRDGGVYIGEYSQQIHYMLRQRNQFQRDFGNDAKRSLRTDDQLFQAIACGAFVKSTAEFGDFTGRGDHFHLIHLMACCTVFDGFVASGIGGDIAADETTVAAAGVAGIQQIVFGGGLLDFFSPSAGLHDHEHIFRINFENLIHFFQ